MLLLLLSLSLGDPTSIHLQPTNQRTNQLLEIFTQLEEQNLFLIQNSQETEQALEELRQQYRETRKSMESKTQHLTTGIGSLRADIDAEDARAASMRLRSRAAHGGGGTEAEEGDGGGAGAAAAGAGEGERGDDAAKAASSSSSSSAAAASAHAPKAPTSAQEDLLSSLHGRVADVFGRVCATTGSDPSSLSMLKELESKLEDLLFAISAMPERYVAAMEKLKEKERRERVRQERMAEAQRTYEERMKKSMARSLQPPKKRRGRQVMWRSRPLRQNVQLDKVEDEEDEDAKYLE